MFKQEDLDARLKSILQCTVCKFLPKAAIFQCPQGHLICTSCFTGIFQFPREDETPKALCPQPNCGALLSKAKTTRNVAVERVVQELSSDCRFCCQPLPHRLKAVHERDVCPMRPTACRYRVLGCSWAGPQNEAGAHECLCPWPRKPGAELLASLQHSDQLALQDRKQWHRVFELLSTEALVFADIQLKRAGNESGDQDHLESFRFEAFSNTWTVEARVREEQLTSVPEITYQDCYSFDSGKFCAFNNTWVVRACFYRPPLNNVPEHSYQLVVKSQNELPCEVTFCLLQGPLGDFKVSPKITKHQFNVENDVSPDVTLCFTDSSTAFNPVSTQFFNFRIFMFLTPKKQ